MSNNPNNPNTSNENIRLFRTITDATEPTALTFLSRTNTITEALNIFYMSLELSQQRSSVPVVRTTSSTNVASQPVVNPAISRSVSMVPGAQSVQAVRTVNNASSTGQVVRPGATMVSASSLPVSAIRNPSPVRKKQVKKKKKGANPPPDAEPESPPTSPETSPERQGKRTFSDMIAKYVKEDASDEAKKKKWPKYLGSLKVQCECLAHLRQKIQVGDVVTFAANEIGFRLVRATKKNEKTYTIKGSTLNVGTYWERSLVGYLKCQFEEIFVFLLTLGYVIMDGTVLTKPSKKGLKGKSKRFEMRVDIFLTEEAVKDPLNIITQPGRKTKELVKLDVKEEDPYEVESEAQNKGKVKGKKKTEEGVSEAEQKMHHICRLTKESFIKLFEMLQIKVTTPPVVQIKQKRDPFNAVRKDKYGGYRNYYDRKNYTIRCYEAEAELLTDQYPNYYRRKNQPEPARPVDHILEGIRSDNKKENSDGEIMQIEMKKEESKTIDEDLDELEKQILKKYGSDNFEAPAKRNNTDKKRRNTIGVIGSERRGGGDFSDEDDFDDEDEEDDNEVYESSEDENLEEEDKEPFVRASSVQAQNPRPQGEFFNPFSNLSQGAQPENENQGGQVKSHLNDLFNLQNQNSNHFSLSEPPTTFKSELHVYQKQALTWMKYREGGLENQRLYDKLNEEIRLLNDLFEELVLIDGSKIYFNPFNGEITVDFPKSRPCKGGLLADEMGLGKTVMTIALIHAHKRPQRNEVTDLELEREGGVKKKVKKSFLPLKIANNDDNANDDNKAGTLIIVPVTVLSQWENEMFTHSNEGTVKVMQYYGGSRDKNSNLADYDVIVTSYGVVGSDYAKQTGKKKTGLFAYNWFRVILDEAHFIKGRGTRNAKACCTLEADYRWCLTGTPLQNKLDDLFSIIKFLRLETWGEYYLWNTYINKDTANDEAFELLRSILRPIILRRTKKSTYLDGRNILELPPKEVRTQMIQLTPEERQIYNNLFSGGKNQFDTIVSGGTLKYEYAHVFELLMRLRQVCDHPSLVFSKADLKDGASLQEAIFKFLDKRENSSLLNPKNKSNAGGGQSSNMIEPEEEKGASASTTGRKKVGVAGISNEFLQDTIKSLEKKELAPCTVCLDDIVDPVITNCCHVFCRQCIMGVVENLKSCPICRKHLALTDVMPVTLEDNKQVYTELLDVSGDKFKKSSKLQALFDYIHIVRDKKEKVVVFSQFLGMLTLIEKGLKDEGIKYRRLDGSCTLAQRTNYINEFKTELDVTVFMVSLKAGAIGLNLTVANHCVLVDPWWNPAVEDQAIERVHRIGQKNSVTVVRLICEKTIEERMLDLHAKKKGLVNMTLHFNPEEQKKQNMENMIYIMRNYDDA